MPEVNWKIDLGHILVLASMVIGGAVGWGQVSAKLDEHAKIFGEMRNEINLMAQKLSDVREQQIKTQTELDDRLERDKKYIVEH